MSYQVHFFLGVCGPKIDGEDEVGGIDVTASHETSA